MLTGVALQSVAFPCAAFHLIQPGDCIVIGWLARSCFSESLRIDVQFLLALIGLESELGDEEYTSFGMAVLCYCIICLAFLMVMGIQAARIFLRLAMLFVSVHIRQVSQLATRALIATDTFGARQRDTSGSDTPS